MGGLSIWKLLVILGIVVLIFGTKRLASGAKDLGKAVNEFKKGVRGDDDASAAQLPDQSRDQTDAGAGQSKSEQDAAPR